MATLRREQLRGKAGVPGCENCRERAVPRRARWYCLAGFGFARSANYGTVSRAKGRVGKQHTPKITSEKQEWKRSIEFCGYRKVIDANPTDFRYENTFVKIVQPFDKVKTSS
jgi:hypothetical protein